VTFFLGAIQLPYALWSQPALSHIRASINKNQMLLEVV
jgi:hypothetical protein